MKKQGREPSRRSRVEYFREVSIDNVDNSAQFM